MKDKIEVCPKCFKYPKVWRERHQFGSRELIWVGCQKDGYLEGGLSRWIAVANWNRRANRLKFERAAA